MKAAVLIEIEKGPGNGAFLDRGVALIISKTFCA